jgi:hypothetical protein
MIIELYGLPGSGKTTLSKNLSSFKDFKLVKIENNTELVFFSLLSLLRHPIVFLYTFYLVTVNSSSVGMFYYKFMNILLHRNAKHMKAFFYKSSVIDEGFSQNILSIYEKTISKKELKRIVSLSPKPNTLVVFNIDSNILENRVKKTAARRNFGEEYYIKWKEVIRKNNELFLHELENLPLKYVLISNQEDVDTLLKKYEKYN